MPVILLLLVARARAAWPPAARWAVNGLALGGAVLLAWSGVIHLRLWSDGYDAISVIGPLFLAQGIAALVFAAALAIFRVVAAMAAAAVTLAATAAGLLVSAEAGLFGYRESLAVPYAESSLVIEFTGTAVLLVAMVGVLAGRRAYDTGEDMTAPGNVAGCGT